MARTVTKLAVRKKPSAPEKPKTLTLEEARAEYEVGTKERLVAELAGLAAIKDESRELTNKTNRQKTQAGKAFIAYLMANQIEPGNAEVHVGDTAYGYNYSVGESISSEKLFDLYERKKITKDQFLKSISVVKEAAKRHIGDHILVTVMDDKVGKKMDIRTRDLDTPAREPNVVLNIPKPKPANKLKRTNTQAPGSAVRSPVQRIRRQRIIR